MMEIMGEPNKDFNEAIKYIRDVVQKRVDEAYKKGVNDGSLDVKIRTEGAYQKGFTDGKEYGLDEADMREAVSYQKGLSDAWEAAKKIIVLPSCGGINGKVMMAVFGTIDINEVFDKFCPFEAIEKLKIYEEKQKNKDVDKDACQGCVWEGRYDGDCAMCSNNYRELYRPKDFVF